LSDLVLSVKNLKTYFYLDEGILKAVDDVTFDVRKGETIGIIGESGCGKSVTAQSVLRIVPPPGRTLAGSVDLYRNGNVETLTNYKPNSDQIRDIRGKEISMIFQEPMTSLSPVHTIGNQIIEAILLHKTKDKKEARELAIDMIARVGIPNPELRVDTYPHQLSGGLRQRAMIAMALSCNPSMLIADEPTTALDVTIQAQILELIQELQDQFHMAVMFITHNLGVIAEISEDVAVMYLGKIVEFSTCKTIFHKPMMPYTENLMKSIPKVGKKGHERLEAIRGTVPIPLNLPRMCGFYERCQKAMEGTCNKAVPALKEIEEGHFVRCFLFHKEEEEE
jgi:oligopeptide/dipeptide ABC transporter ATP-binding protein